MLVGFDFDFWIFYSLLHGEPVSAACQYQFLMGETRLDLVSGFSLCDKLDL